MVDVIYASAILLSDANKSIKLSVVMLSVIMLNVIAPYGNERPNNLGAVFTTLHFTQNV